MSTMNLGELLKQKLDEAKKPTLVDTMVDMYVAGSTPGVPLHRSYDVKLFKLTYYDLKTYKEEHVLFCSMERLADFMSTEMSFQTVKRVSGMVSRYENLRLQEHSMNVYNDDPGYCPPEYIGDFYMIRWYNEYADDVRYSFVKSKRALIEYLNECSDAHPEISTVSALGEWKNEGDVNVFYWS